MFTGLIETLGTILSVEKSGTSSLIGIRPDDPGFMPKSGASAAIDGACLTLEHAKAGILFFTAVAETLSRTTLGRVRPSARVNLEQAMKADGRFDGHMVLGHVDGIGTVVADKKEGTGIVRTIRVPENCSALMAEKGSVAVDGISLTIAGVEGSEITLALIPRTLESTTMVHKRAGDAVNIECDVLARYVYRTVNRDNGPAVRQNAGTLLEHMERAGF